MEIPHTIVSSSDSGWKHQTMSCRIGHMGLFEGVVATVPWSHSARPCRGRATARTQQIGGCGQYPGSHWTASLCCTGAFVLTGTHERDAVIQRRTIHQAAPPGRPTRPPLQALARPAGQIVDVRKEALVSLIEAYEWRGERARFVNQSM